MTTDQIKQYDFTSLFTQEDNNQIMTISKSIIDSGNYFKNSPKYQTQENLFSRREPVWLKMRQSFIYSCFMFLGKEARIKGINSWVFMTSAKDEVDRNNLWHHHYYDHSINKLSGIWYVYIPKNVSNPELTGTEFAFNGVGGGNDVFNPPNEFTWNIYPSKLWHRPGVTDSEEYRFVFAADMEYFE
jgi:hypothetical protein